MPKVGKKHFAYTPAGKEAAAAEASATGAKVERGYAKGGTVKVSKKKEDAAAKTKAAAKRKSIASRMGKMTAGREEEMAANRAGKALKEDSSKTKKALKEDSSKTKKALRKYTSKTKKDLKKSGDVLEEGLRSDLKKAFSKKSFGFSKGGAVNGSKKKSSKKKKSSSKAPKGYVVARGSGAARPQYFKVNT